MGSSAIKPMGTSLAWVRPPEIALSAGPGSPVILMSSSLGSWEDISRGWPHFMVMRQSITLLIRTDSAFTPECSFMPKSHGLQRDTCD